jgi:uncharacterized protein (TIGR02757 family)
MRQASRRLHRSLEKLRQRYDARYLGSDPLSFPRRFSRPDDREVVGLVASALAYGNVKTIRQSLETVLSWMGPRPASFARRLNVHLELERLDGFQHRWTRARDVVSLVSFAGQMLHSHGGIGRFFAASYVEGDMRQSISLFSDRALALDHCGSYSSRELPARAGVRFFFTSPRTGACKRINMYLRWMIRPDDGIDLGLWRFADLRDLVMPLDTHIYRIGRHLGWTERKTPGWKTAVDITRSLAELDPNDPVKYDFALSRMGILEGCPRHPSDALCELCAIQRS